MARIYTRTDRIKLKIDDVTVSLSPLSYHQKTEAQLMIAEGKIKKDYKGLTNGLVYVVKNSLKDVSGLEKGDGSEYKLSFEEDGSLTDECVTDLFNIELKEKLVMVCMSLVGAIPKEFVDEKGNPIEGVSIIPTEKTQNPN